MLLDLLAPPGCLACRGPARGGAVLCPACAARVPWLGRTCPRCAQPRCGPCPARDAPWTAAWSPVAMAGPARALVHALKFDGALRVAGTMAAQLAAVVPSWAFEGATLVPVPAHPWRGRRRGVDHARAIAEALGARTGLPVAPVLRHRGGARRQVGAGRVARQAAVETAIEADGPVPEAVLLVDDVHTTGATLRACAAVAGMSGAGTTYVLAYARALSS